MSHCPRPHNPRARSVAHMLLLACGLLLVPAATTTTTTTAAARAADTEYTGKLDTELVANREDLDQVILKPLRDLSKVKFATPLDASGAHITASRLYHPAQDKSVILALLVEVEDETPQLYADLNVDGLMSDNERFALTRGEDDNPYLLEATLKLPLAGGLFTSLPLYVQYLRGVRWNELAEDERMILQSKTAYARGQVDVAGKKTLVQFGYKPQSKKISATNGWLGIDGDGDGLIDMDRFSPEAAEARDETIVFRVGDQYVSAKRVDVEKNVVLLRTHAATDYKRVELRLGGEVPDFGFTDFAGKKRKLSEFRGKYVLIDFWGLWCPACRTELPYLKLAYSRFQARGFEILGMNTDQPEMMPSLKATLKENNLTWTQAQLESIREVIRNYRIHLYPSTLLVDPEGKIVSLNQTKKGQPSLRGQELIRSLDRLLPP
jgi:peroxiredoxin